ncbi:hypothetical protein [Salinicoccus carnicancri]|uniref:hypothetical protein n=1 Tax=Salinicoccus carnicancri TaxID=558170 RepID=UPI00036A5CEC|nr:hypothetical protein [Salinicoccus carnicancri]
MGYMPAIAVLLIILAAVSMHSRVTRLEQRMKSMQQTLDHLTDQTEIPENPINDELRKLIEEGDDIKAVKKARETLGLSLLEGKEYIDELKNPLSSNGA